MHAFLITAYKDPSLLKSLITSLMNINVNIYIHIDRKYEYLFKNLVEHFVEVDNVNFIPSIDVSWGGASHFTAIMSLLEFSYKDKRNLFFHLLSGQDLLVRPLSELFDFFSINSKTNFLEIHQFRSDWKERVMYYNMHDLFPVKKNRFFYKLVIWINLFQKVIGLKRTDFPFPLYCGSTWWSLNRSGADTLIHEFAKLRWRLKYTFCAEEFFPHSVLMNSFGENEVVNNNLRFILWTENHTGPDTLNISHYADIVETKSFFCRKVEFDASAELLEKFHLSPQQPLRHLPPEKQ